MMDGAVQLHRGDRVDSRGAVSASGRGTFWQCMSSGKQRDGRFVQQTD